MKITDTPIPAEYGTLGDEMVLPLMPLREVVMFPHSVMPLFVGRDSSIKAIESAIAIHGKQICLVVQREPDVDKPGPDGLYTVGVMSRVLQLLRMQDGTIKVLFEGISRVLWEPVDEALFSDRPYATVRVVPIELPEYQPTPECEALVRATHEALEEYGRSNKKLTPDTLVSLAALRDPGKLADTLLPHLRVDYHKKQEALETLDPAERLQTVYELLHGDIEVISMEKRIKSRVKNQMEHNQREYYLSEQLKAIHKEMGREDDPQIEYVELEQRLNEKNMPEEARAKGLRELKKMRQMPPSSAEYAVVRNYVDWILDLPWNEVKETEIDIQKARDILEADHYGLEKPKERILEYLAVQKLTNGLKGPILCLVGPPGVGKTSLARSVAKATGREYVRLSLGGVRDEAEIRGHRRTYVGAMPGKIITALKRAKFNNPLFCLDEIDKMSADFRGDPSSALLEVLDPEQNNSFNDHYLDMDYDLSQIFFITTANSLHTIPAPLQDRMEIIQLSSYLDVEKRHIAKGFLMPRQLEKHGLTAENLVLSESALQEMIRSYTREAGVRSLEREIAALCRKVAIKIVEDIKTVEDEIDTEDSKITQGTKITEDAHIAESEKNEVVEPQKTKYSISPENLESYLGVKKYRESEAEKFNRVGVVNGLAYTGVGGDVLEVEAVLMPGKGEVTTTGKLGDVMTESAKAALSFVRSHSHSFGLKPDFHRDIDIHLHFPAGATPKDGPSAGIAITCCLVSALLGEPVRHDTAMTGEVSLRGRVLPIGGLREKLLAASRNNIKRVIIPRDNEKDLKEVPEEILKLLEIFYVDHVSEVLPLALEKPLPTIEDKQGCPALLLSLRASEVDTRVLGTAQ